MMKKKNAKAKLRLLSAVHRKKGKSIDEIASLLSKSRRTIHGWLVRFQQRGINAKDGIKQSGRPVELTIKQRKKLLKTLERGPPHNPSGLWSTKEVRELITKNLSEHMSSNTFGVYLFQLDFLCNDHARGITNIQARKR